MPFFDDFVTPLNGPPDAQFWMPGGGAYVSNRFALMPLTRGTATFDALKADGSSYSGQVNNLYDAIDSLTSQPIDLSGLTAASAVYLSFARQAGGLIGNPTPPTRGAHRFTCACTSKPRPAPGTGCGPTAAS